MSEPTASTDATTNAASNAASDAPRVGVVMGSRSDWETMRRASEMLAQFDVPHECRVVSAHRTPRWLAEYAEQAESRGLGAIIAGAGGAAHLPGMLAAHTIVPVLGVPVQSKALQGTDSLLSIVQMPRGVPVATFAIGESGAVNAGLFAVAMLGILGPDRQPELRQALHDYRNQQRDKVLAEELT